MWGELGRADFWTQGIGNSSYFSSPRDLEECLAMEGASEAFVNLHSWTKQ